MSLIESLKHKKIVVLGAGITGLSCARFLQANNLCFAINDNRENPLMIGTDEKQTLSSAKLFKKDFPLAEVFFGRWNSELIAHAEYIIVSPGIDLEATGIQKLISEDCKVWGDVELFCRVNNEAPSPIKMLAVTGSNGKSTVVSLLHSMGKSLGKKVCLGGNIGQPVLDVLTEALINKKEVINIELMILELSSFQLETLESMNALGGAILNISDDHLDRHKTIDNYQSIKQKIYRQSKVVISNRNDDATSYVPMLNKSGENVAFVKQVSFGSDIATNKNFGICSNDQNKIMLMYGEKELIALNDLKLTGIHNALNYLAALALGRSAGWSLEEMLNSLNTFPGLAHRCQRIETHDNINWVNDSKATNVGAAIAAIEGIGPTMPSNTKLIYIAGGDGKGADFSPLKPVMSKYVSHLITLGKDGDQISSEVNKQLISHHSVVSMEEAVSVARNLADNNDTVLLSPACASIDMFKNFVARGEIFIKSVKKLESAESRGEL